MCVKYKVNYHINECCNCNCVFCFARTYTGDTQCKSNYETKIKVIKEIAKSSLISGINFAGGEPLLDTHILDYVKLTRELNLEASIVTNGLLLLKDNLIDKLLPYISMLGLSFHSLKKDTNIKLGYTDCKGHTLSYEELKEICDRVHSINPKCRIKVNTVVNSFNNNQVLKDKLETLPIDRWKLLKCQHYDNNDECLITQEEFESFVEANKTNKIDQVIESNMDDSYIMLNPQGCLKQKTDDKYILSDSVLNIPLDELLKDYKFNSNSYKMNHKEKSYEN